MRKGETPGLYIGGKDWKILYAMSEDNSLTNLIFGLGRLHPKKAHQQLFIPTSKKNEASVMEVK